ncbi:Lipolytic enzyme, G-D-S-L [Nostoc sp. NIES-3756]|uniref:SGNH/GDSL hydrolase family protein n=1 Tax=Nostoc sp. NIES-3756 TaxID=1751286 RepID=UPI0007203FF1|nr:SGNH/GDSL hydrolase family protein [Nostoc sp. NIES-3756]BAT51873.1 Lipolytic enzyme, G-D-S-L [Nostoc sp. NIES-3756]BAY40415.1 lipolytic enzyme, G-D-S-L [Nostoc sp. NIES-2111]
MKTKIIAASFITLSSLLPLKASAQSITGLYVFGDSLSDTGNTFNLTGGLVNPATAIPPSPPNNPAGYYQGRFSNGEIWVDRVGQQLGLTSTPITSLFPTLDFTKQPSIPFPTQGLNFAIGGANSGEENAIVPNLGLPGVLQQVSLFQALLQANQQSLDPNALYAVSGGSNDFLFPKPSVDPTKPKPYENIAQSVSTLAAMGAKNILVFNLADLGTIPAATLNGRNPTELTQATQEFNSNLAKSLDAIRKNQKANIIEIDIFSLVNRVKQNPSEFGFTNVTDACLAQFPICNNDQSEYFFWDAFHPTTAGQKLVADAVLAATTPESPTTIGLLALGALGAVNSISRLKKKSVLNIMSKVTNK